MRLAIFPLILIKLCCRSPHRGQRKVQSRKQNYKTRQRTKLTQPGNVKPAVVRANLLESLDSLLIELNLIKVLGNTSWVRRLGNDGNAANLRPSNDNLSWADGLAACG